MNEQSGRRVGGSSGLGVGVLIVWLAGYFGLAISAEVATVIGGFVVVLGAAIGSYGIVGCWQRVIWGRNYAQRKKALDGRT
jgi:hypothetical protein